MPRYLGSRCHAGAGALFLVLLAAAPLAAVELSGVYVSQLDVFSTPCTLTFAQTGSALTISGPCNFVGTIYTFDLAGTVDPTTGIFTASGRLIGLCETPGSVSMSGSGDGEVFNATANCNAGLVSAVHGTKCGNGVVDTTEDCEDGNTAAGDCCSPICRFDAVDSACTADTNACSRDACDGAGHCQHQIDPGATGSPCATDFNECTDDVCDATGQCLHPNNSAACDDANACTTADTCALGTCVGGPIAAACVGSIDLTGDWELMPVPGGLFATSEVRHFEQTGAVLESSGLGAGVGIGSVNPATGAFESHTPFVVLYAQCLEVIDGTASADSQTFGGSMMIYCGLDGTFGPFTVSGRRCAAGTACACAIATPCTRPDRDARLMIRSDGSGVPTRWQWSHSAMPSSFGDPTVASDYRFCLETADGGYVEEAPHGSSWRATGTGFRYRPGSGVVRTIALKTTAKKTVIRASLVAGSLPTLPSTGPVRLRLVHTGPVPVCFEAEFATPRVNTSSRYLATE